LQLFSIFNLARAVAPTPRLPATQVGFDSDMHHPLKSVQPGAPARQADTECDAF